jgi:hypothetical protein
MTISEAEEALFARWRLSRPDLVADGVVDGAKYLSSQPRVVFLLKEVNDTSGTGRWDLRDYVRGSAKGRTWDNVARWTYAIRSRGADTPWSRAQAIAGSERADLLRSIAVVNLKKSPGRYVAVAPAVYQAAVQDRELLREQLALYQPAVTIWCGTDGSSLFDESCEWHQTRRGVQYCRTTTGRITIRYSHPSARVADWLLFYGLCDAVREIIADTERADCLSAPSP